MKVSIRPLTRLGNKDTLHFSGEIDLSSLLFWGSHPFVQAVRVTGQVKYLQYGRFRADYEVEYTPALECARCLTEIAVRHKNQYSHALQEASEDPFSEDRYIPITEGLLDVNHMVSTDLLLTLDDVTLCSSDCKGICTICGKNRNQTECDCTLTMPDPRFDVLRDLLDKSSK